MSVSNSKQKLAVSIDQMLPHIGEFGRFQKLLEVLFCFSLIPLTLQILLPYFTHDNPTWRCTNFSSTCNIRGEIPAANKLRCNLSRTEWTYTKPIDYSISTQFDLQCGKEFYSYICTSTFFLSWAVGALTLGWFADRYGRYKVLLLSQLIVILGGLVSAFSPNLAFYAFSRALIGFFIPGVSVSLFVMASEIVGSKYRPLCGMLLWAFFAFGLVLLGMQAYFIRKWKYLIVVSTAPYFWLLLYYNFIPESIRWLWVAGRSDEAMEILRNIAKFNGCEIPENVTLSVQKKDTEETWRVPLVNIFRPKKMAFRTLIQGYIWMIESMVYYGITLAADDLGGNNRYVNYILSSLVDFPCVLAAIYFSKRIGRKKTAAIPLFIGSILCIIVAFIPSKESASVAKYWPIIRVTIGLIGKFFVTVSFDTIYTWSAEIYPTVVRGEGMGYLQIKSRIGAALAPWVTKWLIVFHPWLPFLIMGSASFVASILAIWLPETAGTETAETLETSEKENLPLLVKREDKV